MNCEKFIETDKVKFSILRDHKLEVKVAPLVPLGFLLTNSGFLQKRFLLLLMFCAIDNDTRHGFHNEKSVGRFELNVH